MHLITCEYFLLKYKTVREIVCSENRIVPRRIFPPNMGTTITLLVASCALVSTYLLTYITVKYKCLPFSYKRQLDKFVTILKAMYTNMGLRRKIVTLYNKSDGISTAIGLL